MQTAEVLEKRRSVRAFEPQPIPAKIIEEIIAAARLAPTARNIQPWEFIAVTDKALLRQLASWADNGRFIADCPCCIGVFCKDTKYYLEDGCAATQNILLAATDAGVASCWVAGDKKPYAQDVSKLLAAPQDLKLISLVSLGYAHAEIPLPAKRPLEELIHWNKFGNHSSPKSTKAE